MRVTKIDLPAAVKILIEVHGGEAVLAEVLRAADMEIVELEEAPECPAS